MMIPWLASIALFVGAPTVAPEISSLLEPTTISIGDVAVLKITVKHAAADEIELPKDLELGGLELLDKAQTSKSDGPIVSDEFAFKLTGYEPGSITIAGLSIKVGDTAFTSEVHTLVVASVLDNDPEAQAASMPVRRGDGDPISIYEDVYWPLVALGSALAIAALVFIVRRMKQREKREKVITAPTIPAHQAALQLLKMLRQKGYLERGQFREYYFESNEIIRAYLAHRYAFNALDLTTDELMVRLSAIAAQGLDREKLRQVLEHADLVKFAKFEATREQAAAMLDFFEATVWNTRPPEPRAVSMEDRP